MIHPIYNKFLTRYLLAQKSKVMDTHEGYALLLIDNELVIKNTYCNMFFSPNADVECDWLNHSIVRKKWWD